MSGRLLVAIRNTPANAMPIASICFGFGRILFLSITNTKTITTQELCSTVAVPELEKRIADKYAYWQSSSPAKAMRSNRPNSFLSVNILHASFRCSTHAITDTIRQAPTYVWMYTRTFSEKIRKERCVVITLRRCCRKTLRISFRFLPAICQDSISFPY